MSGFWSKWKAEMAKRKVESVSNKGKIDWKGALAKGFRWLLFMMLSYAVIAAATIAVPSVMGLVIGSFGYTLQSNAELLLAALSGLFFTLWAFALSFYLLRAAFRVMVRGD